MRLKLRYTLGVCGSELPETDVYMIFLNVVFWPRLKTIFITRSLKTTRNNPTSPHNGPIKIFILQHLHI
jgi:hypothetical protein